MKTYRFDDRPPDETVRLAARAANHVEGRILTAAESVPSLEVWEWLRRAVKLHTRQHKLSQSEYTEVHRAAAVMLRESTRVKQGKNGEPFSRGGWRAA